jgi:glutathione S-transferase
MFKLYYSPGTCARAPHIVLRELGLPFEAARVDLKTKVAEGGEDYRSINPKGYVPALRMADGGVLTEAAVILGYLADQKPEAGLAPAHGTLERYRLDELLSFIATEFHKGLGAFWNPKLPADYRAVLVNNLNSRLEYLERILADKTWLCGSQFTVADAYLYTVLGWAPLFNIDLSRWPTVKAYWDRVDQRPAVRAAVAAETQ